MQRLRSRRHRFLHLSLFVLVVLGVLIQPILGSLGGLHGVEHAVAAQSDHGHAHHDGHEDASGGDGSAGDAVGSHFLLHQGAFATAMALLEPTPVLLSFLPVAGPPASGSASRPPPSRLTLPFRPPIA